MELRVAIVDDSASDALFVRDLLTRWARERDVAVRVEHFSSAERFLFAYDEERAWDILLLDIEMGQMDGVSLAKRIRTDNSAVQIVFITGFADFVAEGYEVAALHYLMKPVQEQKLFSVLDRARIALGRAERVLMLPTAGALARIPLSQVMYVEAFAHTVTVVTPTQSILGKLSISEVEKMLGEGFVRAHRSYLVGLKHIARLTKTEVILDNGTVLPLARSAADAVHKAFISYYTGETDEAF